MSDLLELLNLLTVTDWVETRSGFYYNGKGYTDVLESRVTVSIPDEVSELIIIADNWNGAGCARIQLDGYPIGEIHDSIIEKYNNQKLKICHTCISYYSWTYPGTNNRITHSYHRSY